MPENRQNENNADDTNIEEGMKMMKIEKKEGEEGESTQEYPDRPGEPDCIYYCRTGFCGYGTNCRFNHPSLAFKTDQGKVELPQREGQPDCGYYLKTGTCKYGATCKYHHPGDRRGAAQISLNNLGLPMREEKPCPHYMRTYTCKFGQACKFDHPPPPAPVSGAAAVGMGSAFPLTGTSYVGAYPAWSWTRSSYTAPSRVPGAQAYMPFVIPSLQGPLAAQSWNGYPGNMSAVAASNLMGTDLVYNSKNQGGLVTGGQVDLLAMTSPNHPERPDQPECRYFMSTGNCRYGSSCKFHHPKERVNHIIGSHGLPIRPGKEICSFFSSTGSCNYGETCKFSHPVAGYVTSCYYGMPSIPPVNQPYFPSQRKLPTSNSTENSQSKSSKITDWIQKPEGVGGKDRQHGVTITVEDSHEQVDHHSVAPSAPTSSEVPQEQSD